jgi:hypothetical protein
MLDVDAVMEATDAGNRIGMVPEGRGDLAGCGLEEQSAEHGVPCVHRQRRAGDEQLLTDAEHGRPQVVPVQQLRQGHTVPGGDFTQGVAGSHHIGEARRVRYGQFHA